MPLRAAGGSSERVFGWWRLGRRVAFDLAQALNYIHSQGVVHMVRMGWPAAVQPCLHLAATVHWCATSVRRCERTDGGAWPDLKQRCLGQERGGGLSERDRLLPNCSTNSPAPNVCAQDVKSSNCLLTAAGSAKLGDCGLARLQVSAHA